MPDVAMLEIDLYLPDDDPDSFGTVGSMVDFDVLTLPGQDGADGDPGPAGIAGPVNAVGGLTYDDTGNVPIFDVPDGTIRVATPDQYASDDLGADLTVGGTDWADAIDAALAGGPCIFGGFGKVYPTSGRHTVPEGSFFGGFGGAAKGTNLGSTTFQLIDAGAGFDFVDGGHTIQDVMIDGNNVATQPVHIGSSDPTHVGAQTTVRGLAILHAAPGASALSVEGHQNARYFGLNIINNGGIGINLTGHAGGSNFYGTEVTGSGSYAVHSIDSGNFAFWGGIFERSSSTTGPAVLTEGSVFYPDALFDHCTTASGGFLFGTATPAWVSGTSLGTGLALSAAADTVTKTAHGLFSGQAVSLSNIVTATGVSAATQYWVLNPTANTFQLTATQYGTTPVNITADGTADVTKFIRYLFEHRGTGTVELRSCKWAGIPAEAAVLCAGADVGAGAHAPTVALTGIHTVTHTIVAGTTPGQAGGMVAFIDGDALGVVFGPDHQVRGQVAPLGPVPLRTGNLPDANISQFRPTGITVNRTAATLPILQGLANGDSVVRVWLGADGTLKWSSGSAAADVTLYRSAAGVLTLIGGLGATGKLAATGWRDTRVDHTASGSGTITIDADAADMHHVFMAGFNVTLAISGGTNGQRLFVYVQQSASPGTLTLPLQASSVFWSAGDTGKPTLTSATGWLTFVLENVGSGVWVERGRAGTNVTVGAAGALLAANNLNDVASASTSRTSLGLGTAATAAKVGYGSTGVLDATTDLQAALSAASVPVALGTAATGGGTGFARQGHVHPTTGLVTTGGYGITSSAVALDTDSGALGSPVGPLSTGATTLLTTASLAAGKWLITVGATVSVGATATNLDLAVVVGTATATFSGQQSATTRVTANNPSSVTLSVFVTVTVAGTLLITGQPSLTGNVTVQSASVVGSTAKATGYTAVRIS